MSTEEPISMTFEYVIFGYLMLFLEIFGIIGNLLSLAVLGHHSMRNHSSNVYLSTLATADALLLCCSFMLFTLPTLYDNYCITLSPTPIIYPLALTLQTCTLWVAVALTIERFIVISNPWSRVGVNVKKARFVAGGVCLFSVCYNLPRWFELDFVVHSSTNNATTSSHCAIEATDFGNHQIFLLFYYSLFYVTVNGILPLSILAIINTYLILKLRNSEQQTKRIKIPCERSNGNNIHGRNSYSLAKTSPQLLQDTRKTSINLKTTLTIPNSPTGVSIAKSHDRRSPTQKLSNASNNYTWHIHLTLIAIIGIFIICQIPCLVYNFGYAISNPEYFRKNKWWQNLSTFRNFSATFQSSVNFILYCLIGQRFRKVLVEIIPPLGAICCAQTRRQRLEYVELSHLRQSLNKLAPEKPPEIRTPVNPPQILDCPSTPSLNKRCIDVSSLHSCRAFYKTSISAGNSPHHVIKCHSDSAI